jgi:hypothetical protein
MESERTSLIQRLGQLLGGRDTPPGPAIPRQREPASIARGRTGGQSSLENLRTAQDRIAAGSLQLIGLSGIRNTLGERWEARNEQISRLIEAIFRRRLDVTDAYFRVDDENFLILFTRLRRHEAEFKARAIAEEIEKLIVGEDISGQEIAIVSCVAEIDRRFVLEKVNSLDELLDHVRTAADTEWHEVDVSEPLPHPAGDTAYSSYIPELEQDFSVLFQRTSIEDYLKHCSANFRPMFNTKRRTFSSFLTSVISKRTGRMVLVDDDPLLDKPEELLPALDRFTLGAALLGLHRMISANQQTKLVIPISYDTLSISRLREQYFSRLREVPDGIRTFIAFAVTNLPVGMPASRLGELISYLRPLSSLQVAHVAADVKLVDIYAGTGCYGLSTEMPVDQPDSGRLHTEMSNFARRAHLHRSVAILANINSRDDLRMGITAGFDIIWGDAVSGTVGTPGLLDGLRSDHIPG